MFVLSQVLISGPAVALAQVCAAMRRVLLAALGLLALVLLLAAPAGNPGLNAAPAALFLQAAGAPRLEQRSVPALRLRSSSIEYKEGIQ